MQPRVSVTGLSFIANQLWDTDILNHREDTIPSFELENSAQRGGANILTIAETALAGKGLIKIGGKWFVRNGDDLTEVVVKNADEAGQVADDIPITGGPRKPGGGGPGKPGSNPKRVDLDGTSPEVRRRVGPRANATQLEPNTTYVKNGYEFTTDSLGRPIKVEGDLTMRTTKRVDTAEQRKTGHLGKPGDEGGHLVGSQFDGPTDAFNLVPQTMKLNRGKGSAWAQMERDWVKALDQGKEVRVSVEPKYNPGNTGVRPDSFEVTYTIDGGPPFKEPFPNV